MASFYQNYKSGNCSFRNSFVYDRLRPKSGSYIFSLSSKSRGIAVVSTVYKERISITSIEKHPIYLGLKLLNERQFRECSS